MQFQLTVFLSILVGTGSALSQQAYVFFENNSQFRTPADRFVYADVVGGTKLVGTNYFAQLYYGADANHLISATNTRPTFRPPTTLSPGTWKSGNTVFFPGFTPGEQAILQVKVWDGSLFNTYEQAVAGGGVHGESAPFPYPILFSTDTQDYYMDNLRAFSLNLPFGTNNHSPVAYEQAVSLFENSTVAVTLGASDIDGDSLNYTILNMPSHGSLSGTPPNVAYTPVPEFIGVDSFFFQASDGRLTDIAVVTITVSAGGTVYFGNDVSFLTAADRLVYADFVGGTKLVGTNYFAQLYYGAPNNLIAVTNAAVRFRPPTTQNPGTWLQPGERLLPGFLPGTQVTLQVRVWDGSLFNSFEDAVAGHGIYGQSAAFLYDIPFLVPAPDKFFMENLRAFALNLPLRTNTPPVAVIQVFSPSLFSSSLEHFVLVAPNNSNVVTILDGSLSTDADNDPLQYSWFIAGTTQPFADGIRVTNSVETGVHLLTLRVSDGTNSGTITFGLEIIPPGAAAEALATQLEAAPLAQQTEKLLLERLSEAEAAFDRSQFGVGVRDLRKFQQEILDRVAKLDPALSLDLVTLAQKIIDAVSQPLTSRIQELILSIELSNLATGASHQLLEPLIQATKDFSRSDLRKGLEDLNRFQKKIQGALTSIDPALAQQFLEAAQKLIDEAEAQ